MVRERAADGQPRSRGSPIERVSTRAARRRRPAAAMRVDASHCGPFERGKQYGLLLGSQMDNWIIYYRFRWRRIVRLRLDSGQQHTCITELRQKTVG
jgi:hypothetical protein